jgi:4-amino-4-deoxy-L-arabinose transferase-like glycosyltransferase
MSATPQTLRLPRRRTEPLLERLAPRHAGLAAILALSALLNLRQLSQNGYANTYYSGAVKSMLGSFHNFLFVSADPGGFITVDKPPLGLWLQAISAKIFGFSSLSLLLPEAICGVLAVALLYRIVTPRFGVTAALLSALALAVFPSLVAVSRDNLPDALLILLMVAGAGAALRATETGSLRWLLWCAVLVGLAFNTKMLAGFLIVPGIAIAYLACAPGSPKRRLAHLAAAAATLAVISVSWLALVQLTPASDRPWVGSTEDNNAFSLALNYNGIGRVAGQAGGPSGQSGGPGGAGAGAGTRLQAPGGGAASSAVPGAPTNQAGQLPAPPGFGGLGGGPKGTGATGGAIPGGGAFPGGPGGATPGGGAIPGGIGGGGGTGGPGGGGPGGSVFGGPTGLTRLFGDSLGAQGGWLVPFGLAGVIAIGLTVGRRRRDPRLAGLIVFGGWFLVEAVVLSFSKGIVHPYYVSAMGPGLAAMVGAGAVALAALAKRGGWRLALPAVAIGATAFVEVMLLQRESYLGWFVPLLVAGAAGAVLTMGRGPRYAKPAVLAATGLLLIAPAAYATTVWNNPVSGTFPAAGNTQTIGPGGPGGSTGSPGTTGTPGGETAQSGLGAYVTSHDPGSRWDVLTQSSMEADPLILSGVKAGAIGGFNGSDPALSAQQAARMVAKGEVRYFALGSAFPGRQPNAATTAVESVCTEVPSSAYESSTSSASAGASGLGGGPMGQTTLYDCAGKSAQIAVAA